MIGHIRNPRRFMMHLTSWPFKKDKKGVYVFLGIFPSKIKCPNMNRYQIMKYSELCCLGDLNS